MRKILCQVNYESIKLKIIGLGFEDEVLYTQRIIRVPLLDDEELELYIESNYDEFIWLYIQRVSLSFKSITSYKVIRSSKSKGSKDLIKDLIKSMNAVKMPKPQQVVFILDVLMPEFKNEQKVRDDFEVVMNHMWEHVKQQDPYKIVLQVLNGMHIGYKAKSHQIESMRLGNAKMLKAGGLFKKNLGIDPSDTAAIETVRRYLGPIAPVSGDHDIKSIDK